MKKFILGLFLLVLSVSTFAQGGYRPTVIGNKLGGNSYWLSLDRTDTTFLFWRGDSMYLNTSASNILIPSIRIDTSMIDNFSDYVTGGGTWGDSVTSYLDPINNFTDTIPAAPVLYDAYIANQFINGSPDFTKNTYYKWNGAAWDSTTASNGLSVTNKANGKYYIYWSGLWRVYAPPTYSIVTNGNAVKGYKIVTSNTTLTGTSGQVVICGNISSDITVTLPTIGSLPSQMRWGGDFYFVPYKNLDSANHKVIIKSGSTKIDSLLHDAEYIHAVATPLGWKWSKYGWEYEKLFVADSSKLVKWTDTVSVIATQSDLAAIDFWEDATTFLQPDNMTRGINCDSGYYQADDKVIDITNNVYIGNKAGAYSKSGVDNIMIGEKIAQNHTTGSGNILLGMGTSSDALTTGIRNIVLGSPAFAVNDTGDYNIGIGFQSLYSNKGDNNLALGHNSGAKYVGSNALFINSNASPYSTVTEDTTLSLIYGRFDQGRLKINGTLSVKNVSAEASPDSIATLDYTSGTYQIKKHSYITHTGASAFTPLDSIVIPAATDTMPSTFLNYKVSYVVGDTATIDTVTIANGSYDGQEIEFIGLSDTFTVTFASTGNMLVNAGTPFTLNENYIIGFRWSARQNRWLERYRSANGIGS